MTDVGTIRPEFAANLRGSDEYLRGKYDVMFMPNNERRKVQFVVVPMDDIIASHNELTFASSDGYPTNEDGSNINDRNYTGDKSAQAAVQMYAEDLQPERLIQASRTEEGTPVISLDGYVVSGNNRTMSIKRAAKLHPDKYEAYRRFLVTDALSFGIDADKMRKYIDTVDKPILVRVDYNFPKYKTLELSKYNKDPKKAEASIDQAIKLSQILQSEERCNEIISDIVAQYELPSDLYKNVYDQKRLGKTLVDCNILTQQELTKYIDSKTGIFTRTGKEFLEQLLAAMVLKRDALIAADQDGVRNLRNKMITSLPVLIKNKQLGDDSLIPALNNAIILENNFKRRDLDFANYINQLALFDEGTLDRKAAIINRVLNLGRNKFKKAFEKYNDTLAQNQSGAGMFGDAPDANEAFKGYFESLLEPKELQLIDRVSSSDSKGQQAEAAKARLRLRRKRKKAA